jgi:hypothetical protein
MSVLSWGKPTIKTTTSTDGTPGTTWTEIDTPKEDTTELTVTAGDETTATEEGGAIVDVRYKESSYELTFTLFVKKGSTAPWTDTNGIIEGEHAIRILPPDADCFGIQIDRCTIRCELSYSAADGMLRKYTCKGLKPATGNILKIVKGDTVVASASLD